MNWLDLKEQLPPFGVLVRVKGLYIPEGDHAVSKMRDPQSDTARIWGVWDSNEWRCCVGITHWMSLKTTKPRKKKAKESK